MTESPSFSADLRQSLAIPLNARIIACLDPTTDYTVLKEPLWIMATLRFLHENLYVIFGQKSKDLFYRLEEYARDIHEFDYMRFHGQEAFPADVLATAEIGWITSRNDIDTSAITRTLSAGRPIVAARSATTTDWIIDGETGFLVPYRDKAAFARQTQRLLENADLRGRMGEAARKWVGERVNG